MNTGDVEGVETVQAYTRDLVGVESRPGGRRALGLDRTRFGVGEEVRIHVF